MEGSPASLMSSVCSASKSIAIATARRTSGLSKGAFCVLKATKVTPKPGSVERVTAGSAASTSIWLGGGATVQSIAPESMEATRVLSSPMTLKISWLK